MPKTLTIIILFVVCAIAAAAGGYLAVKQSGAAADSSARLATQVSAPVSQGTVPAQTTSGKDAVVPEPPIASAPAAVAPDAGAESVRSTTAPKSSTSAVNTKPAPARPAQSTAPLSRPSVPSSEMVATGRTGTGVGTGAPAGTEPPVLPPQTPQVSAPPEPPRPAVPPPPPVPMFEELVVPAESVLGLQVLTTTSTEEAKVEDPVEAKVTRDVRIGGTVAIPAGTRVQGVVTVVERGGKVKGKARLGVRFHMLVLADAAATRVPIRTDTIFRESDSKGQQSAAKIGAAAAGGAILGAIIGGGKGAAIGSAIGAGSGTASVMSGDRSQATLQAGTAITVRLQDAVTVTVER
jgi:hypothetical protein